MHTASSDHLRTMLPENRGNESCSRPLPAKWCNHAPFLQLKTPCTGILSHLGAKLRDWAVSQARAGCYSQAALSSNDLKTLYINQRRSL